MKFNKHITRIITSLLFALASVPSLAQELVRPVITGAPFLQIVPDARSGGMGEVGVASFGDAYSQYHNPAKYLFMEEGARGIGLSYIPQFLGYANDIFHANATYHQKLNDRSTLSGSLTYFNYGDVVMEEQMGNEIIQQGTFVPNELSFEGSYSLKLNENFGMAVTGRYIRSDITDNQMNSTVQLKTAQAIAADVTGYYISSPYAHENKWTAGFAVKNIGSKLEYANETGFEYPLPASIRIGGGYHLANGDKDYLSFYGEALKFMVPATGDDRSLPDASIIGGIFNSFYDAPDGFSEEMKEVIFSVGSELRFNEMFNFRAGYITQNRDKGMRNHITLGAGITWENLMFDFAYQSPISNYISFRQDKVLKISLSVDLGRINFTSNNTPEELQEN